MYYWLNDFYSIMEITIKEGQNIPKLYDKILVHQHDETGFTIEFTAQIIEIISKKLVHNKLVLTVKYDKIEK